MGVLAVSLCLALAAQAQVERKPAAEAAAEKKPADSRRTELNLLGKTDAAAGESRRNENITFNLIDNNALKELNVRMGTTATIVQEFRAERNYFGSEFGNPPSAPVHAVSPVRAGFHGGVHMTHQNSVFGARSFFQAGGVEPAHENDYGFTLGSRLWRGASVFLEGGQQKIRGSVNGNVLVPRADERTPLSNDPATRAIVARYLAAYPARLPNRTDVNERALNTNAPQAIDSNSGGVRLDQSLGRRDRLAAHHQFVSQAVDAFQLVAGQNPDTDTRSHRSRLTWTRQWSASTAANVTAGFDRIGSVLRPEPNAVGPMISISGLETLGPQSAIPINRAQNLFRWAADVRRASGNHAWTAGLSVLRRQLNGAESDTHRGFFSFTNDFGRDGITNLRLGVPTQHLVSLGNAHRGFRNWDLQFFLGDNWRVRPGLSLQYGLRYQPVTTPVEVNGLNEVPYPCDCNNAAPQFGLAWRPGSGGGVLRAAYGLHFGEIFPVTFQQVRFTPPGNRKILIPLPDLVNPLGTLLQGGEIPDARTNLYLLDAGLRTPYSHQYNFSWEPAWSSRWRLQLGYVGSRSHKLLIMRYTNRAHPVEGIPLTSATINQRRPDQRYADIRRVVNGSRGYFDAARASLVVAGWRRLSADVSYWFSKALDLGSSYTNTAFDVDSRLSRCQSEYESRRDMKGPSAFDQAHAFLTRVAWALPERAAGSGFWRRVWSGWTISTVLLVKTGMPFTAGTGSDGPGLGNVDSNGGDRPNLLDPSVLGRTIADPDTSRLLLPRSAFAYIRPGEERGNLGRNTFRKGGIRNVNAAISRTWAIDGEKRLTFRAESVNLLNTPQFAEPGFDLANSNFGQITNTLNDGRTFRFSAQFGW